MDKIQFFSVIWWELAQGENLNELIFSLEPSNTIFISLMPSSIGDVWRLLFHLFPAIVLLIQLLAKSEKKKNKGIFFQIGCYDRIFLFFVSANAHNLLWVSLIRNYGKNHEKVNRSNVVHPSNWLSKHLTFSVTTDEPPDVCINSLYIYTCTKKG